MGARPAPPSGGGGARRVGAPQGGTAPDRLPRLPPGAGDPGPFRGRASCRGAAAVGPAANVAQADPAPSVPFSSDRPSGPRIDYDLDHGTPMGPDARGFKSSH